MSVFSPTASNAPIISTTSPSATTNAAAAMYYNIRYPPPLYNNTTQQQHNNQVFVPQSPLRAARHLISGSLVIDVIRATELPSPPSSLLPGSCRLSPPNAYIEFRIVKCPPRPDEPACFDCDKQLLLFGQSSSSTSSCLRKGKVINENSNPDFLYSEILNINKFDPKNIFLYIRVMHFTNTQTTDIPLGVLWFSLELLTDENKRRYLPKFFELDPAPLPSPTSPSHDLISSSSSSSPFPLPRIPPHLVRRSRLYLSLNFHLTSSDSIGQSVTSKMRTSNSQMPGGSPAPSSPTVLSPTAAVVSSPTSANNFVGSNTTTTTATAAIIASQLSTLISSPHVNLNIPSPSHEKERWASRVVSGIGEDNNHEAAFPQQDDEETARNKLLALTDQTFRGGGEGLWEVVGELSNNSKPVDFYCEEAGGGGDIGFDEYGGNQVGRWAAAIDEEDKRTNIANRAEQKDHNSRQHGHNNIPVGTAAGSSSPPTTDSILGTANVGSYSGGSSTPQIRSFSPRSSCHASSPHQHTSLPSSPQSTSIHNNKNNNNKTNNNKNNNSSHPGSSYITCVGPSPPSSPTKQNIAAGEPSSDPVYKVQLCASHSVNRQLRPGTHHFHCVNCGQTPDTDKLCDGWVRGGDCAVCATLEKTAISEKQKSKAADLKQRIDLDDATRCRGVYGSSSSDDGERCGVVDERRKQKGTTGEPSDSFFVDYFCGS
eukprot:GHVS01056724.1.p1 GENE.GHVS01056724.1~~GHVS01056724.1.p1  ORF type:complete len:818 (+),score=264.62 GHVS01056724.1:326-2455(+)